MKAEKWSTSLWAAILSFCIAFGGIACLVTGFGFSAVSLKSVALCLAIAAVLISLSFALKAGWAALPVLLLALVYFRHQGSLMPALETLLYGITVYYDRGYDWGYVRWSEEPLFMEDMTLALCLAGILLILLLCRMVCRRKPGPFALLLSLAPFGCCLVVTDTVPDAWCLGLYFGALALLLMTHTVRRQSEYQGNRLTWLLALPLALAVTVLLLAVPKDTYDGQERAQLWSQYFVDSYNRLIGNVPPGTETLPGHYSGEAGNTVNLSAIGPKRNSNTPVMDVTAAVSGTLYLRGRAYDIYSGKGWDVSDRNWNMDSWRSWGSNDVPLGQVTVTTRQLHSVLYLPYNVMEKAHYSNMQQGKVKNTAGALEYSFSQVKAPAIDSVQSYRYGRISSVYGIYDSDQYLDLPEETLERARQYMAENIPAVREYYACLEYSEYLLSFSIGSVSPSPNMVISGSSGKDTGDFRYPVGDSVYEFLELGEDGVFIKPENNSYASMSYLETQQALALAIADHVRNSARYSLNTPRMPGRETDFALWFLEDSDTGYCVHYATAATVLLRALGIPARYVTGYMVEGRAGRSVTVREKDAHAWVEVYLDGVGWTMMEVTGSVSTGSTDSTDPTEGTDLPTVPTIPTNPEDPTRPTATRPEPTPEDPTEPQDGQNPGLVPGGDEGTPMDLTWLWSILKWVGIPVLALALLIGQWRLRLELRHRRFDNGSPNARAMARWRELERLRAERDDALIALARKAKFSQHTLMEEELALLDEALERRLAQLRAKSLLHRLWYRLILAAY